MQSPARPGTILLAYLTTCPIIVPTRRNQPTSRPFSSPLTSRASAGTGAQRPPLLYCESPSHRTWLPGSSAFCRRTPHLDFSQSSTPPSDCHIAHSSSFLIRRPGLSSDRPLLLFFEGELPERAQGSWLTVCGCVLGPLLFQHTYHQPCLRHYGLATSSATGLPPRNLARVSRTTTTTIDRRHQFRRCSRLRFCTI